MIKPAQPPILTKITSLSKHPNADTLEIAKVLGFQVVVKQDQYVVNEEINYFEPDTAFTLEDAQLLNIDRYLSTKTDIYGDKVLVIKEVKLRGELSEGLILPTKFIQNNSIFCFKYQAPSAQTRCENAAAENAKFPQYGSLENLRKSPNFFSLEDTVFITDKNCWEWQGALDSDGYGKITVNRKTKTVHRVSYEFYKNPINKNNLIRHLCHNARCYNPDHLAEGSVLDNRNDDVLINNTILGIKNNKAKLTESQVLEILRSTNSAEDIALIYKVTKNCIWQIKSGYTWPHLHAEHNNYAYNPANNKQRKFNKN